MSPFSPLYASVYDALYCTKDYSQESERICSLFSSLHSSGAPPRSLHDLACGTGRHLEHFSRNIEQLSGNDCAEGMIEIARRRLPSSITLTCAPMQNPSSVNAVQCAVCLFDAICYLKNDNELLLTLRNAPLEKGGLLFIEYWHDAAINNGLHPYREREFVLEDKSVGIRTSRAVLSTVTNSIDVQYSVKLPSATGEMQTFNELHTLRYFSISHMESLLTEGGFTSIVNFDGYKDSSPSNETWHVLVVARKR